MPSAAALDAPSPKKRGRPQKGEGGGLRAELIEKSAQLFRTKGYDNTTVRDIAAAAGIQAGSWFYHFKTKQDILAAIMAQGLAHALAEIEASARQPLPPCVLLYEWRSLDSASRERIITLKDRYEAVWDHAIATLHRSGHWAMPSQFDRLLIFGALNWTVQWYKPGSGADLQQLAQQAMLFILRTPAALEAQ